MDVIEFRYLRSMLVAYAVLAAGMIGFGAFLILTASAWGADLPQGIFIIIFCIFALIFVARAWFKKDPVVEVSLSGIRDRRICNQRIPWDDIEKIKGYGTWENRYFKFLGWLAGATETTNRFIGIIVKEPERYYRMSNPILHVYNRFISWLLGYPLLSINMGPLDGTYEDLSAAIVRFTEGRSIEVSV